MKHWVGYRAEIKNEIAALEKFGKENEMRPFHLWNGWYPNLATPLCGPQAHTQKRVWISPYTLFFGAQMVAIFNAAGRAAFGVPRVLTHA